MAKETGPKASPELIELAEGHRLSISEDGKSLSLTNVKGLNLQLRLTPEGPVLDLDVPTLTIRNQGDLKLEADNLHIKTKGQMIQEIGGDFEQRISGHHHLAVRDDLRVEAQALGLEAVRGELELKASDDVALEGLRILHNVPREEDIEAARAKVETFGDFMALPAKDPNSPRRLPNSKPVERKDWD